MTNPSPLDEMDKNMVALFRRGDEKDYRNIYNKYAPAVLGVLIRTFGDVNLAEECVKASFCEMWNKRLTFDPSKERLFTWMLKMVKGSDSFQSVKNEQFIDNEIREEIDLVYATDIKFFLQQKNEDDGERFAAEIDEDVKKAIFLIYFKGYSFSSAAEQLGIPVVILRGNMIKILKQLKGTVIT